MFNSHPSLAKRKAIGFAFSVKKAEFENFYFGPKSKAISFAFSVK